MYRKNKSVTCVHVFNMLSLFNISMKLNVNFKSINNSSSTNGTNIGFFS